LAASFKRIKNILRQAESSRFDFGSDLLNTSLVGSAPPDPARLTAGPELDLYNDFLRVRQEANHSASYREKLVAIASLRPMVDLFFDKILVNDPDLEIRKNRLALLHSLLTEFSTIADFSEIVTQGTIA
ncbi:MAG: glycine--tRNA ligase subunit beta, partial [Acidobacteriaceae bacterium]|nr:glycine--tRNA ligase subunit beta [Acidobacteriaceae bacterium]